MVMGCSLTIYSSAHLIKTMIPSRHEDIIIPLPITSPYPFPRLIFLPCLSFPTPPFRSGPVSSKGAQQSQQSHRPAVRKKMESMNEIEWKYSLHPVPASAIHLLPFSGLTGKPIGDIDFFRFVLFAFLPYLAPSLPLLSYNRNLFYRKYLFLPLDRREIYRCSTWSQLRETETGGFRCGRKRGRDARRHAFGGIGLGIGIRIDCDIGHSRKRGRGPKFKAGGGGVGKRTGIYTCKG